MNNRSFRCHKSLFVASLVLMQLGRQAQGDTYPAEPYNGLQLTYSLSGATITSTDENQDWTRTLTWKGTLQGSTLRISGAAHRFSGFPPPALSGTLDVTVQVDGNKKAFHKDLLKDAHDGFDVSVPIPRGAKRGSVVVELFGKYSMGGGSRNVRLIGSFVNPQEPSTPTPTKPKPSKPPLSAEAKLNKVLDAYFKKTPKGIVGSGNWNNLLSWWDDKYKEFACGGYQGKVLAMLDAIKWSDDPEEKSLLDAYDYGPIEAYYGGHQAVVIYPKGGNWVEDGIVLDPWPTQSPKTYNMAEWASRFSVEMGSSLTGGTYRGIRGSSVYEPNREDNPDAKPEYPTVGGAYVDPRNRQLTKQEAAWLKTLPAKQQSAVKAIRDPSLRNHWVKQQYARKNNNTKLMVQCPLNAYIQDQQGRISGFPGGTLRVDVEQVLVTRLPLGPNQYWTEFEYPRDPGYKLVLEGTGTGSASVFSGFNMTQDERSISKYSFHVSRAKRYQLSQKQEDDPLKGGDAVIANPITAQRSDAENPSTTSAEPLPLDGGPREPAPSHTGENVHTLRAPSDSILLAKTYSRDEVELDMKLSYTRPGTVLDTVGLNAAPVGSFYLTITEQAKLQIGLYDPEHTGPGRAASGWHILSTRDPISPGVEHTVTITLGGKELSLVVNGKRVGTLSVGVPLSGKPIFIGDFPGDDHWGDKYNIHPAMRGKVTIIYMGKLKRAVAQ